MARMEAAAACAAWCCAAAAAAAAVLDLVRWRGEEAAYLSLTMG